MISCSWTCSQTTPIHHAMWERYVAILQGLIECSLPNLSTGEDTSSPSIQTPPQHLTRRLGNCLGPVGVAFHWTGTSQVLLTFYAALKVLEPCDNPLEKISPASDQDTSQVIRGGVLTTSSGSTSSDMGMPLLRVLWGGKRSAGSSRRLTGELPAMIRADSEAKCSALTCRHVATHKPCLL